MKTALLISGKLRFSKDGIESLKTNIIDVFKPDIFCSFWDDAPNSAHQYYINELSPKSYDVENFNLLSSQFVQWFPYNIIYQNLVPMLWKFQKVNSLKQSYELANNFKYDFVIQARPDGIYFEKFPFSEAIACMNEKCTKTTLAFSPDIDPFISPRMADTLFVGDNESMNLTAKTFWLLRDQLVDNFNASMHHHNRIPEIVQSQIWNKLGIKISTISGTSKYNQFNWDLDRNYLNF